MQRYLGPSICSRHQNLRKPHHVILKMISAVPENIHTPPTEAHGISMGVGYSVRPKIVKKCMKLDWNFQRGGGVLDKISSMGEVWIFSGITHYFYLHKYYSTIS